MSVEDGSVVLLEPYYVLDSYMIDTNICKYYQMYYWMYHIDVVYVLLD